MKEKILGKDEEEPAEAAAAAGIIEEQKKEVSSTEEDIPEESAKGKNLPRPEGGFIVSHSTHAQ